MKKLFVAAVGSLLLLTGCTTVSVSEKFSALSAGESNKRPVKHINVSMSGCYLFGFVPLFTGSARTSGACAVFKNTMKMDNLVLLMSDTARKQGGVRLLDMQTSASSNFLLFPLIQFRGLSGSCNTVGRQAATAVPTAAAEPTAPVAQ